VSHLCGQCLCVSVCVRVVSAVPGCVCDVGSVCLSVRVSCEWVVGVLFLKVLL
jgi:hypothetical protein